MEDREELKILSVRKSAKRINPPGPGQTIKGAREYNVPNPFLAK